MKNIQHIKILAVLLIAILFNACAKDYLDEESYQTDYKYFETDAGLNALVTGCYVKTRWPAEWENGYIWENMGTDMYMGGADGGQRDGFAEYRSSQMNASNGTVAALWSNNYSAISYVNQGLQSLAMNATMREETKAIRKGELLFLRAYYYYMLVVHYGDIPLILEPLDAPKLDFPRDAQKVVWAQIIEDARQAWDLLPWADASGTVTGDYGRASKGAAGHLLTKSYMFRYSGKYAANQSDANMIEDRGMKTSDLDSAIYYSSRVCNFGEGAGSGSNHALAADFSELWGWDQKTGMTEEYKGTEVVFAAQFSTDHFYNNQKVTDVNDGGNWMHLFSTMFAENIPLSTSLGGSESAKWGTTVGVSRDLVTGRPWRRFTQTPFFFTDNGLYGSQNYASNKPGKLIDSRLYKAHVWVYYCNSTPKDNIWLPYSNGAGSFDPETLGKTEGEARYDIGDTAILLSVENVDNRFSSGTAGERLALARSMEKYWYIPMQSIPKPQSRAEVSGRDMITNSFPTSAKFLDSRRAAVNNSAGFRDLIRYRLGETYIMLAEAYALKGDFTNAAEALNMVRNRAAWKSGELKYAQYWKYDGGTYDTRTESTESDMRISASFISGLSENGILEFFLDENGRETAGELNRWECLVRNGADFFVNRVKAHNYFAAPNVQPFHRFRPIPQAEHIDRITPQNVTDQNYGYN